MQYSTNGTVLFPGALHSFLRSHIKLYSNKPRCCILKQLAFCTIAIRFQLSCLSCRLLSASSSRPSPFTHRLPVLYYLSSLYILYTFVTTVKTCQTVLLCCHTIVRRGKLKLWVRSTQNVDRFTRQSEYSIVQPILATLHLHRKIFAMPSCWNAHLFLLCSQLRTGENRETSAYFSCANSCLKNFLC